MGVSVFTDSACSLRQADIDRLRIGIVPLYIVEGGRSAPTTAVDVRDLYARLPGMKALPTTSQPAPADFAEVFALAAERGDDVLAVLLSARMSATLKAAELAAEMTRERYPAARITIVDSESNSMQEGYAVLAAAEAAASGSGLAECADAARATVRRTRFLFAPESLEYLARGGRISGAARFLGSALRVVPILTASGGTTGVAGAVRSYGRALSRIAELMRADVERFGFRRAVVQFIGDESVAGRFARDLIQPIADATVPVVPVPAVVGIHVGPALGVAYETRDPMR